MDDQRFDDSIKNKIGEYEATSFDPADLAALHHQLSTISSWPWYAQYRTELLVGSGIVISSMIILWSQWVMSTKTTEVLKEKIASLQTQQEQIDKLQNEISTLKNTPPDTIRIIEIREQPSSDYTALLYRIKLLEAEVSKSSKEKELNPDANYLSHDWNQVSSSDTKSFGQLNVYPNTSEYKNSFSSRISPRETERESLHATPDSVTVLAELNSKSLSAKTIRDIEDHYQKGIGIRIGPAFEISKSFCEIGNGKIRVGGGVLADFILSPSISLETGLKLTHRVYDITDKSGLSMEQLPGMDPSLGALKKIDIDSWVFDIPLNLKYRYPVSIKTHWLGGLGYSALVYGKQVFEYEYAIGGNPDATVNSGYETSHAQVYPGALNFSLGISKLLKSKKTLETFIYYQLGLGETGVERNSINYLGVRGVYWFTAK